MSKKRLHRNLTEMFKAQVALAALNGEKSITEISEQFEVDPNQIGVWRAQ